jgi:hypothetical protein
MTSSLRSDKFDKNPVGMLVTLNFQNCLIHACGGTETLPKIHPPSLIISQMTLAKAIAVHSGRVSQGSVLGYFQRIFLKLHFRVHPPTFTTL